MSDLPYYKPHLYTLSGCIPSMIDVIFFNYLPVTYAACITCSAKRTGKTIRLQLVTLISKPPITRLARLLGSFSSFFLFENLYIAHKKTSTQNLACSQRGLACSQTDQSAHGGLPGTDGHAIGRQRFLRCFQPPGQRLKIIVK